MDRKFAVLTFVNIYLGATNCGDKRPLTAILLTPCELSSLNIIIRNVQVSQLCRPLY